MEIVLIWIKFALTFMRANACVRYICLALMFVKINHECAMLMLVYALSMFIYARFINVHAMFMVVCAKERLAFVQCD